MTDNTSKTYASGRCCVFQPFDKGDFDKRYDDVLVPAIENAHLEPYRVDRDAGSVIPVDTLHREIRSAAVCIADITTRNPNVMYELGFAIAAEKDVVIISGLVPEVYPFDIQHRGILSYLVGSPRDFKELEQNLTVRLNAILDRREKTAAIVSASPIKANAGLQPHELTALALLLANSDATDDVVSANWFKQEMRKAGYSDVGTRLAMAHLVKLGYAVFGSRSEGDESWTVYGITEGGEEWLVDNQAELELQIRPRHPDASGELPDEDIPF